MSGLDLTGASGILKEFYLPVIREQLNNQIAFLTEVEKNTEDIEGSEAVLSLHVTRNSGVGARKEGGTLPTHGSQGYTKERVPLRTLTGRMKVTVQAIKALASGRSAFTKAVSSEMEGLTKDVKRDLNRQLFGTSDGKIATFTTTTAATPLNLATTTSRTQMRQLEVGMQVDIGTLAQCVAGSGGRIHGAYIVSVDIDNKTIAVSTTPGGAASSLTTAATDFVFRAGNAGATADQKEITGLQTIVNNSGALYSVDPASYPVWKSYVSSNSGTLRSPSEPLLQTTMDEVDIASSDEPTLFVTEHGVYRAYGAQLVSQKRFTDTIELKGGYKGLDITSGSKTAMLTRDRDCPANKIFALNPARIQWYKEQDWDWMSEDGAILNRVPDQLAYEATIYCLAELGTDERNAHGRIDDVQSA